MSVVGTKLTEGKKGRTNSCYNDQANMGGQCRGGKK